MIWLCVAERDAFDTLFDHAPDKLNVVKKVCVVRVDRVGVLVAMQMQITKLLCVFP